MSKKTLKDDAWRALSLLMKNSDNPLATALHGARNAWAIAESMEQAGRDLRIERLVEAGRLPEGAKSVSSIGRRSGIGDAWRPS